MPLLHERHGAVAVIRLNRPERANALDPATIDELGDAFDAHRDDRTVSVLVLTGAGDHAFCSGMDLRAFSEEPPRPPSPKPSSYFSMIRDGYPKPVVAAVNGAAVAGGFELMLACDLSVVREGAPLGIPEVRRGLIAGAGGTLLPQRLPLAIALELGLTGETITAERALVLGLVNRVVPADRVLPEALALAEAVAAGAPTAVAATKRLMRQAARTHDPELWRAIEEATAVARQSADVQEGARAFLEKRPPRWPGA